MLIRIKPAEGNQSFCMAPWTHTYCSPQGERRLCCASREEASWQKQYIDAGGGHGAEFNPPSLEQHWNSEKMKSIRRKLMAGETIPECEVCNKNVLNLYVYRNYFTDQLFKHKIDEAFERTADDGTTSMPPISFDYRFSNLCNYKCVMCGEQLSSSWETEKRVLNAWSPIHDKWMLKDNRLKIKTFQEDMLEQEFKQAIIAGQVEEIYWVGGEPLMWDIHWWAMKYLVDNDMAKNTVVRYNTNLSRVSYKDAQLFELLPHFKGVNLCASIDGTGSTGEFIRFGLKWNEWLQNFKDGLFLLQKFGCDAIVFDVTITLPGLFDLTNLAKAADELGVKSYLKLTFDFDANAVMSPMSLPRRLLEPLVHKRIAELEHIPSAGPYIALLRDMLSRQTFEEKYPDHKQKFQGFKRYFKASCDHRGNYQQWLSILSQEPEILQWWNND